MLSPLLLWLLLLLLLLLLLQSPPLLLLPLLVHFDFPFFTVLAGQQH